MFSATRMLREPGPAAWPWAWYVATIYLVGINRKLIIVAGRQIDRPHPLPDPHPAHQDVPPMGQLQGQPHPQLPRDCLLGRRGLHDAPGQHCILRRCHLHPGMGHSGHVGYHEVSFPCPTSINLTRWGMMLWNGAQAQRGEKMQKANSDTSNLSIYATGVSWFEWRDYRGAVKVSNGSTTSSTIEMNEPAGKRSSSAV